MIARDGKIASVYDSLNPDKHVEETMATVRKLGGM